MNRRRVFYVLLGMLLALAAMVSILCMSLSDHNINGFAGIFGAAKLVIKGEKGVQLTQEPMQYIVKGGNENTQYLTAFLKEATELYQIKTYYSGQAQIKGKPYHYECRAFTNMFWIVTFLPA